MRTKVIACALLGLVLLSWWAASAPTADWWAYQRASVRWESNEPAAYSFDYNYCSGMCAGCRFRITVTKGAVSDVAATSRTRGCSAAASGEMPTIDDVFAMAARDWSIWNSVRIEISYDATWGFPTYVAIRCPEGTTDCGTGYSVTNFRVGQ